MATEELLKKQFQQFAVVVSLHAVQHSRTVGSNIIVKITRSS